MQKRLNNISFVRMISFIFIIVYHILNILSPIERWYNGWGGDVFPFYMSLQSFLFISGYLYANKKIEDKKSFYKKELVKLLVPILVLFVGFILLYFCVHPLNFWDNLTSEKYPFGHLWFVWFLVVCYLLIPVFQKAFDKSNPHHKIYSTILLVCCTIEAVAEVVFSFQIVICVFVFGMWYGKAQSEKKLENKNFQKLLCISIIAVSYIIFMTLRYCVYSPNVFLNNLNVGFQHLMSGFIGTSFAILMLLCFEFLNKYKTPKILQLSDKYSYYIYIWHPVFMGTPLRLLKSTQYLTLNLLITLLAIVVGSVFFGFITQKLIEQVMKPKSPDPYKVIQKVLSDKDFK